MPLSKQQWEDLILEWADAKAALKELEKKEEKLKNKITRELKEDDANTVYTDDYKLTRSKRSRLTISKKDVPKNIWDEYSHKSEFYVLTLTKR
jgi:hypothetical protein